MTRKNQTFKIYMRGARAARNG